VRHHHHTAVAPTVFAHHAPAYHGYPLAHHGLHLAPTVAASA
jgi:hypothetical protein